MTQGSHTYYFAYDQVGSLRAVFTASGALIHEVVYDTYGNILSETDNTLTGLCVPLGFAGGLHDRDTGLVLFGYRDYDPETGRWTTPDPIGFAGGHVDLYGYCGGDPVNWVDADGLDAHGAVFGIHPTTPLAQTEGGPELILTGAVLATSALVSATVPPIGATWWGSLLLGAATTGCIDTIWGNRGPGVVINMGKGALAGGLAYKVMKPLSTMQPASPVVAVATTFLSEGFGFGIDQVFADALQPSPSKYTLD